MLLEKLILTNFRSFNKQSFSFSPQTTLILGPNTSGKTNILEAIYLLATGRSFRAEVEREVIKWGEEIARVKGIISDKKLVTQRAQKNSVPSEKFSALSVAGEAFEKQGFTPESTESEIILTTGQVAGQPAPTKKYLVNGVSRRMIDFVGNLRAVLFWPEDLELVTDSPSVRRKYLDLVLTQVDREYRRCLLAYEKGLRQRNRLLDLIREGKAYRGQLLFWDRLLVKNGGVLTDKRQEYIDFVNGQAVYPPTSRLRQAGSLQFQLEYDKSVISETRLEQYKNEEVAAAATLVGPHRDDFKFILEDRNISLYGSRGEQRMAILWLKLTELEFVASKTGGRPLLLLDDIFSELDHEHRDYVLKLIPQQQTIMTTTDLHLINEKYLKSVKVIKLG